MNESMVLVVVAFMMGFAAGCWFFYLFGRWNGFQWTRTAKPKRKRGGFVEPPVHVLLEAMPGARDARSGVYAWASEDERRRWFLVQRALEDYERRRKELLDDHQKHMFKVEQCLQDGKWERL